MIFASIHNLYQRHNLAYGYPRDLSFQTKDSIYFSILFDLSLFIRDK